jgi:hypothetical protein
LAFIKSLWPSDAFLKICLGGLYENIFKAFIKNFITNDILARFGENTPKTCSLKAFLQA